MANLRKLAPHMRSGEPLMVVVGTDRLPAPIQLLDDVLPVPDRGFRAVEDDTAIDERISRLARLARKMWARGAMPGPLSTLATEARARLVRKPPPGARWANATGCGTEIEGEDSRELVGCGMGHVPARSRRFLHFATL